MKEITLVPDKRLASWGVRYLLFQLLILPYLLEWLLMTLNLSIDDCKFNVLYYTVNFAAVVGMFWRFLQASARHALENPGQILIPAAIGFLAYRLSSTVVDMGIYRLFPDFFNINDASIQTISQGQLPIWAFGTIILVPPAEELLFRGAMFGSLYNRNKILAWVVSVVGFCLLHIISYAGYYTWDVLLICAIQYLSAGICFAAAYRYSCNIFTPILMHVATNIVAILTLVSM